MSQTARKGRHPVTLDDALEAFERLIVAVEWEIPPIRDGVDVEGRCRILMRYARGSKAILHAARLNAARDSDGTATAAANGDLPVPQDCQARAVGIAQKVQQ